MREGEFSVDVQIRRHFRHVNAKEFWSYVSGALGLSLNWRETLNNEWNHGCEWYHPERAKSVKRMLRTKSQEIPVFQGQGKKLKEMGQSSEESEVGIIHESQS